MSEMQEQDAAAGADVDESERCRAWFAYPDGRVTSDRGPLLEVLKRARDTSPLGVAEIATVITPGDEEGKGADVFFVRAELGSTVPPEQRWRFAPDAGGVLRAVSPQGNDVVVYSPSGWQQLHMAGTEYVGEE